MAIIPIYDILPLQFSCLFDLLHISERSVKSYHTIPKGIEFHFPLLNSLHLTHPDMLLSAEKVKINEAEELKLHHLYKLFPFKIISHVSVATITMAFLFFQ